MLNYSVHEDHTLNCLIVGVGNIIRSDDAIGSYLCGEMELLQLPNVHVMTVHQLHSELLEEFSQHDYVIIVDASIEGKDVNLYPVTGTNAVTTSSHAMDAVSIAALYEKVYGKKLNLYVCAIRGHDFSIGEHLSEQAKANVNKAIDLLTRNICRINFEQV